MSLSRLVFLIEDLAADLGGLAGGKSVQADLVLSPPLYDAALVELRERYPGWPEAAGIPFVIDGIKIVRRVNDGRRARYGADSQDESLQTASGAV